MNARQGFFNLAVMVALADVAQGAEPLVNKSVKSTAPVVMDAVKVDKTYQPKLAFGMALEMTKNNDALVALTVRRVRAGSDAADQGVVPMTRIYKIDGRPVEDMKPTFLPGSDLNRIFVDRKNGDQITIEIGTPGDGRLRLIVLTEHHGINATMPGIVERLEN